MLTTMSRIKELPKSSSHLLSCTQIVTSIQSVVKELLENALDSHATSVEIKLENFGFEKIEVKDNGDGIIKDDIHFVAKPHCTSKITSHFDLIKVNTFGFRGEALAAICAVADLAITTKTADEEYGYTYTFDHNGNILSSNPCPCNQGTSVVVTNLFDNVPVRKQLYRSGKKKKDELRMIEDILIAFGCILPRLRFVLFHDRNLIWQKSVVDRTIDGLRQALGVAADYMENCEYMEAESQIKIEAFLPKCSAPSICSQTSSNRSIVAINKRPVNMKSINKLLKEYYSKTLGDGHKFRYPVCFISIEVPPNKIDINFEPNKTAVLLHNMDINNQLSKLLSSFYGICANFETNGLSKRDPKVISPMHDENDISNASDNQVSSNIVDKENGSPAFHLNRSHCANELQNNKPKKLVLGKRLSRKSDLNTSNKKIKFSTPNDVHRHLNTLEAFFSSEKTSSDDANTNSNNTSVSELHIEKASGIGLNSENSGIRNESVSPEQNIMLVTVQRKNSNANDETLVLDSSNEATNKKATEMPVKNSFVSGSSKLPKNCNEISKESCSFTSNTTCSNQAESLRLNEINYDPFVSALSMPNKEKNQDLQTIETNKQLPTSNEIPQKVQINKSNLGSETSAPLGVCNGPHGLYPDKNIQPVDILKPNVVGTDVSGEETKSNAEEVDIQEPYVVSMVQGKITPFDFFCRKHRLEVASLNPELNNQQIAQILSGKWNRLSSEEKAVYKNMVSKDYPRNIRSKEKLGKNLEENINKINSSVKLTKVVQKEKQKRRKRNITFTMQLFQESNLNSSLEKERIESFEVVNCLEPGIWICCQRNKLYLLNCYRLQEAVIYFRLLESYAFESEQIDSFILTSSSLGADALDVILQMEVAHVSGSECISDKRLIDNGFSLKILRGNDEIQIELCGITDSIVCYGVPDLKEILYLIKEKGFDAKLSDCRPGKVTVYLQSEAARIAMQSPVSNKMEDIENLVKQIDSLPFKTCLHSKPFLHELYDLSTI